MCTMYEKLHLISRIWRKEHIKHVRFQWCCHITKDKGNGRQTDRKNVKIVYPVIEVIAEVVRSALPNK